MVLVIFSVIASNNPKELYSQVKFRREFGMNVDVSYVKRLVSNRNNQSVINEFGIIMTKQEQKIMHIFRFDNYHESRLSLELSKSSLNPVYYILIYFFPICFIQHFMPAVLIKLNGDILNSYFMKCIKYLLYTFSIISYWVF